MAHLDCVTVSDQHAQKIESRVWDLLGLSFLLSIATKHAPDV